jgi:hypothetical protein
VDLLALLAYLALEWAYQRYADERECADFPGRDVARSGRVGS